MVAEHGFLFGEEIGSDMKIEAPVGDGGSPPACVGGQRGRG